MSEDKNKDSGSQTPNPNPAKEVQTPVLPTKEHRDEADKSIINKPRGNKR